MAFYPIKGRERSLELFKLFGEVAINVKEAIASLEETSDEAKKTGESAKKIGDGFTKSGNITKKHLEEIAKKANKTTDEIKAEAEKLAKSYKEAGMDAKSAMKKAFSDIEGAADKTSQNSTKSSETIVKGLGKVATAAGAVVTAVVAVGKAMIDIANNTREYRVEMAKLETAFNAAGHTGESATEVYRELHAVLGETDQAVEASNHLAKLCTTEEQLRALTNACIGAFATFGDSLPIEGLTEAANETAKTGVLTGQLADALNWAGLHEDEFNTKLAECNTERQRAALITETLLELYGEVGETYKENNKEILASVTAQEELNAAQARFGEAFEPIAATWYSFLASFTNFSADALEAAIDPTHGMADALAGTQETSEEAAEKVAQLKAQLEEFNSVPAWLWTDELYAQKFALEEALSQASARYDELAQAEENAAIAAQNASDPSIVEAFTVATDEYINEATALLTKFEETYSQVFDKVSGWFAPFEKAKVSVITSIDQMKAGMQSQIDFNNQYSANLQYLKEQGLGGLADAFQSYGKEGSAYAKTVADALQKAGGSATEQGQKIISEFQAISDAQLQSQEELANTLALANGDIENEMQSLTDNYAEKIADLDMSTEAKTNASNTMASFLNGITNGVPGILEAMSNLGSKMTERLQASLGTVKVNVEADFSGADIPGNKDGLDYVPYDEYLTYLHKGEAVLTAEEAAAWRAGKQSASADTGTGTGTGGGVTIVQNIQSVAQTPVELAAATEAYFVQARWAMA